MNRNVLAARHKNRGRDCIDSVQRGKRLFFLHGVVCYICKQDKLI